VPWTATPETPRRAPRLPRRRALLLAAGLVAATLVVYLAFLRTGDVDGDLPVVTSSAPAPARGIDEEGAGSAPERLDPVEDAIVPKTAADETAEPEEPSRRDSAPQAVSGSATVRELSVAEHGVGRRVVNRRLEQRGDRFEEGEVVWFSTRVLGGGRGDSIRHVWLRDGRTMQSTVLDIGGPHWRTHSRKTLWGTGEWTVEARDPDGRVLARAGFTCVPRGS
jgi:hypothetical protein